MGSEMCIRDRNFSVFHCGVCLYKVNRYAWYIGRGDDRDVVRRIIIYSGVYSYALWRRVESCGISGIPSHGGRVESIEARFPVSVA